MEQLEIYIKAAGSSGCGIASFCSLMIWKGVEKVTAYKYRLSKTPRTEILAMIESMKQLRKPNLNVVFYTHNINIYRAIEGLSKKKLDTRKNVDLWEELIQLSKGHNVSCKFLGDCRNEENKRYARKAELIAKQTLKYESDIKIDPEFEEKNWLLAPSWNKKKDSHRILAWGKPNP